MAKVAELVLIVQVALCAEPPQQRDAAFRACFSQCQKHRTNRSDASASRHKEYVAGAVAQREAPDRSLAHRHVPGLKAEEIFRAWPSGHAVEEELDTRQVGGARCDGVRPRGGDVRSWTINLKRNELSGDEPHLWRIQQREGDLAHVVRQVANRREPRG